MDKYETDIEFLKNNETITLLPENKINDKDIKF